jgi:hypothetical protein
LGTSGAYFTILELQQERHPQVGRYNEDIGQCSQGLTLVVLEQSTKFK